MTTPNKTKNYTMFKMMELNRDVNENSVKRLKESILFNNLLRSKPIIVNSFFEVIDGQHRLAAAKALGLDIYYIIEKDVDLDSIILTNTAQQRWSVKDTIKYYSSTRGGDYTLLKNFMEKHKLTARAAAVLLVGSTKCIHTKAMRCGTWKPGIAQSESDAISLIYGTISEIIKERGDKCIMGVIKKVEFCQALRILYDHPGFSSHQLIDQVKDWWAYLKPFLTQDEYTNALFKLYNKNKSYRLYL